MKPPTGKVDLDRRAFLVGLAGASTFAMAKGSSALAQEKKGKETKVLKEVESMIPGYAKVRVRDVTWQPGGSEGLHPMPNDMVCEMTRGAIESIVDGKPAARKTGDVWTCKTGMMISDANKGATAAVMRVYELLKA